MKKLKKLIFELAVPIHLNLFTIKPKFFFRVMVFGFDSFIKSFFFIIFKYKIGFASQLLLIHSNF